MCTRNRRIVGCCGAADVVTVIVFTCLPVRPPKENLASISPDLPGAYSVFVKTAIVQSHEVLTPSILTGFLAVFVNRYLATMDCSAGLALNVCSGFSQVNWPNAEPANAKSNKTDVLMVMFWI
jgi:hypothetical protein